MNNIYTKIISILNKSFPYQKVTKQDIKNYNDDWFPVDYIYLWCNDLPKTFVHVLISIKDRYKLSDIFNMIIYKRIIGKIK